MTAGEELRARLAALVEPIAGLTNPQLDACLRYLELLATWNQRINLTALPLAAPISDATLEKLIVEPIRAVSWIPSAGRWADLGSGGGSPAVPLKILRPSAELHLIESRQRKCAFLRTVARELRLPAVRVHCDRFERLLDNPGSLPVLDVLTVRAVRVDAELLGTIARSLRPGGHLVLFGDAPSRHPAFERVSAHDGVAVLRVAAQSQPVFHVEQ